MALLRRLLWLAPGLAVVTLVAFGVLSALIEPTQELAGLPIFFNPSPGRVQELSNRAVSRIAQGEPGYETEAVRLAELGGAALPFVLPLLDSLPPEGRRRVVRALQPVRKRMGLAAEGPLQESQDVLFWVRFWQEYSIDFRPVVVSRAVSRLSRRATPLRVAEVRRFDTYALEWLIAALGEVHDAKDVERVAQLSVMIAPLLGEERAAIARPQTVEAARHVVAYCFDWWGRHRWRFKTYQGTERIVAMLRDTRYGTWATEAFRARLGLLRSGNRAGDELLARAWITIPLVLSGVVGTLLSAWAWGALRVLRSVRANRVRLLGWAGASLPAVVVAAALAGFGLGAKGNMVLALGCMLVLGAFSSPPRAEASGVNGRRASGIVQTLRAMGWSPWQAAARSLRVSRPAMTGYVGARVASLVSMCFIVETALELPGVGSMTVQALRYPDLNWLMAIVVSGALGVAILQIVVATLLSRPTVSLASPEPL